jgi:hypothetical protein
MKTIMQNQCLKNKENFLAKSDNKLLVRIGFMDEIGEPNVIPVITSMTNLMQNPRQHKKHKGPFARN